MAGRAIAIAVDGGARRFRLAALLALLLLFAQVMFAAHANNVADHPSQSCEYCLAAAISDDPNLLIAELDAPSPVLGDIVGHADQNALIVEGFGEIEPRGPPFL